MFIKNIILYVSCRFKLFPWRWVKLTGKLEEQVIYFCEDNFHRPHLKFHRKIFKFQPHWDVLFNTRNDSFQFGFPNVIKFLAIMFSTVSEIIRQKPWWLTLSGHVQHGYLLYGLKDTTFAHMSKQKKISNYQGIVLFQFCFMTVETSFQLRAPSALLTLRGPYTQKMTKLKKNCC